jgi:hypothetical protein
MKQAVALGVATLLAGSCVSVVGGHDSVSTVHVRVQEKEHLAKNGKELEKLLASAGVTESEQQLLLLLRKAAELEQQRQGLLEQIQRLRALLPPVMAPKVGKDQHLIRSTYDLPRAKAEALAVFLRDHVPRMEGWVLETKVEGGLIVTATPEIQRTIAQLVYLMHSTQRK